MLDYVQKEYIYQPSLIPFRDPLFSNQSNYIILWNNQPYSINVEIIYLVVQIKFFFEVDPITNNIMLFTQAIIKNFVVKVFYNIKSSRINRNRIIQFKNWKSLKLVNNLKHFYIILYKLDKNFITCATYSNYLDYKTNLLLKSIYRQYSKLTLEIE